MINSPIILVFLIVGVLIYAAILYWAGKRGVLWLAVLLSLPAVIGGAMRFFVIDVPPEASPFARYFGWLVLMQLAIGVIAYRLGRTKLAAATRDTRA